MELLSSLLLASLAASAAAQAQQGVLVDGNSQLPDCAQSCTLLIQGAQACSGTNEATQSTWVCFCQSDYLRTLRSSAVGVCDAACTDPADNAQVSTWYNSNCGSDNGATVHADDGTGAAAGGDQTVTDPATGATATVAAQPSSTGSIGANSQSGVGTGASNPGDWWANHYQWIIMLIILAIAFPLIAWGAIVLKRRHDRKRDQITGGFNAGVSERTVNDSRLEVSAANTFDGSGRNSPARTRDAFMPYGYGYSRSASRNASQTAVNEANRHPLSRGQTPMGDMEKDIGTSPPKGKKKILVREKSNEKSDSGGSWM